MTLQRLHSLRRVIQRHNELYYNRGKPVVSDRYYDGLARELAVLEEKYGMVDVSDRVGAAPVYGGQKHKWRMYSLANVYDEEGLEEFRSRVRKKWVGGEEEYVVEHKFDGVAVNLGYENGKLVYATTRGDGKEGDDILVNILESIDNIPREVSEKRDMEVRGEVMIRKDVFEGYKGQYKTGRNLITGWMNSTRKRVDDMERVLQFMAYGKEVAGEEGEDYWAKRETMRMLGFTVDEWAKKGKFGEIVRWLAEPNAGYECDGKVVKVNDKGLQEELGETARVPRHAIAFKPMKGLVETEITGIDFQITKEGHCVPIANLSPIMVGGVCISKVFLFNVQWMQMHGINVGSRVWIDRVGDTIPVVKKSTPQSTPFPLPTQCNCESPSEWVLRNGDLLCTSVDCLPQKVVRLGVSVSKKGLNVKGLGEATIRALYTSNSLTQFKDIFHIRNFTEKVVALKGFTEKRVEKIQNQVEVSCKSASDVQYVLALNIPQLGPSKAHSYVEKHKSFLEFVAQIPNLYPAHYERYAHEIDDLAQVYRYYKGIL